MEDKEVGEMWRADHVMWPCDGKHMGLWSRRCCDLIRKLVEERALRLLVQSTHSLWTDEEAAGATHIALKDFGIPPETWK
jgi:hypothetical protein